MHYVSKKSGSNNLPEIVQYYIFRKIPDSILQLPVVSVDMQSLFISVSSLREAV